MPPKRKARKTIKRAASRPAIKKAVRPKFRRKAAVKPKPKPKAKPTTRRKKVGTIKVVRKKAKKPLVEEILPPVIDIKPEGEIVEMQVKKFPKKIDKQPGYLSRLRNIPEYISSLVPIYDPTEDLKAEEEGKLERDLKIAAERAGKNTKPVPALVNRNMNYMIPGQVKREPVHFQSITTTEQGAADRAALVKEKEDLIQFIVTGDRTRDEVDTAYFRINEIDKKLGSTMGQINRGFGPAGQRDLSARERRILEERKLKKEKKSSNVFQLERKIHDLKVQKKN